jgi:hypothetical protein
MEETKTNFYPCKHCEGSGTCKAGKDGSSCAVCIKEYNLNRFHFFLKKKDYYGLVCGVCGGLGQVEPRTERITKRTPSVIALYIMAAAFFLIFITVFLGSKHFNEILAFSSTLIGTITAYYFSGKQKVS